MKKFSEMVFIFFFLIVLTLGLAGLVVGGTWFIEWKIPELSVILSTENLKGLRFLIAVGAGFGILFSIAYGCSDSDSLT